MLAKSVFDKDVYNLFLDNKLLSIAGSSGAGKTTLALQLVSTFLIDNDPSEFSCLWFQASEQFPKKRLQKMLEHSPGKLKNALNNIFIIPFNQSCKNYDAQKVLIHNIVEQYIKLPPNVKYLVIDNISHHLRYEMQRCRDIKLLVSTKNDFFDTQLYPLIMFCEFNDIFLILIHEITYNPNTKRNEVYSRKLYDRIKSAKIFLVSNIFNEKKVMTINNGSKEKTYQYYLDDAGVKFIKDT